MSAYVHVPGCTCDTDGGGAYVERLSRVRHETVERTRGEWPGTHAEAPL